MTRIALDNIKDGSSLLLHCHGNRIWHATSPHPAPWHEVMRAHTTRISDSAAVAARKTGAFCTSGQAVPSVRPAGLPSSAITSQRCSKADAWKTGKLEAKGESEGAFWFIFKDAPHCIFNHLPRCAGTTRQLASRTIEITSHQVESLRRLEPGSLLPGPVSVLALLFYHSSFPSLRGPQPQNRSGVWKLTWSAKCFKRQGMRQSLPLVLQSLAEALSHHTVTDGFPKPLFSLI